MIRERFDLHSKVALVMGGRGLLGRRIAAALDEMGAGVFAADLPAVSPAAASDPTFRDSGAGIAQLDVDVSQEGSVHECVKTVVSEAGTIDILVYSVTAKTPDTYAPLTESSLAGWQHVIGAELDGLFLTVREVGKVMEAQGGGSMTLLSSIYGVVGNDQRIYQGSNLAQLYGGKEEGDSPKAYSPAVYSAVKGGVISLTRFLAAYWGEHNVRVNSVSPGGAAHPGENEEFVRRYSEKVPLGRKAEFDEIVAPVVFLASDAASYITGHNLVVDGGWTAW
ncbi:MAG: SDR family oxidoreductase [Thermoanaerobaculales bacterium]|nr:SDR family oxidoreductase [Thermoanaerobaculales bacterium]